MNFQQYSEHFERILHSPAPEAPYNDPAFYNYVKLNWSRMNRWLKKGVLSPELKDALTNMAPQKWIVLLEPWCGDAAQIVPFIELMQRSTDRIVVDYQLRDEAPFLIESYLTNGGKAIPKLIAQDSNGNDVFVWGPRPAACQQLNDELKELHVPVEELKIALQNWYNEDEGRELQKEITDLLIGK